MNKQSYLLEIKDITKEFPGVKALDRVKFQLRPGTVHALMGENGAGKSTLMKCLFGIYQKDNGEILLDGQPIAFANPKQAMQHGVAMVHQELNQVMHRNVMDNIWLGRYPEKNGMIAEKEMYQTTCKILKDLGVEVDPHTKVGNLSVSERQMIEITKAASYHSRVLVLDEPTSSLSEKEVDHLFEIIEKLKAAGCGIIYISHKMEEILRIADEITVMRDGKWVGTHPASDMDMDKIIRLMVGRDLTQRFPAKANVPGGTVLEIQNYTALYQPSFTDVSFDLREGEILGVAGLMGSKRTEIVEALFGIRTLSRGEMKLHGNVLVNKNSRDAIKNGFALITEERRFNGIFSKLNVLLNATIANMKGYTNKAGVVNHKRCIEDAQWVIDILHVKTPSQKTEIGNLSGGNQQKVILGRWLLTKPQIFLMDEPTRGIDVGAKHEIYQLMIDLACEKKSIIMVSSEMAELLGVCDRILVMSNGRAAGIVDAASTSQEEIMRLSAMYL